MGPIIGIDFGTTKTIAAYKQTLITDALGRDYMPSAVMISPENELFVGHDAIRHPRRTECEYQTITSVKRTLGKQLNWSPTTTVHEIAALILGTIKSIASTQLCSEVEQCVVAIPAHFGPNQRAAVRDAGRIAGLETLRLINEANAAALYYHQKTEAKDSDSTILVFDFGGGTLDVSILEVGYGVCEVLTTSGDGSLGGDDFDKIVFDHVLETLVKRLGPSLELNGSQSLVLMEACRFAKEELSAAGEARIYVPSLIRSGTSYLDVDVSITGSTFHSLTMPLVNRARKLLEKALTDYRGSVAGLDTVLLTGGTSRIPAVRTMVENCLNKRCSTTVAGSASVALGADLLAGILEGRKTDILLLDVWPAAISLANGANEVTTLIQKNTSIPTLRSEIFTTVKDNQDSLEFQLLQGEAKAAADNKYLGSIRLTGLTPAPKGVPQVELTVDIDANGIVNVTAKDVGSGKQVKSTLSAANSLNKAQLKVLQAKLAQHFEQSTLRGSQSATSEMSHESPSYALRHAFATLLKDLPELFTDQIRQRIEMGISLIDDYTARGEAIESLTHSIRWELMSVLTTSLFKRVKEIDRKFLELDLDGCSVEQLVLDGAWKSQIARAENQCRLLIVPLQKAASAIDSRFELTEDIIAELWLIFGEVLSGSVPVSRLSELTARARQNEAAQTLSSVILLSEFLPSKPQWRRIHFLDHIKERSGLNSNALYLLLIDEADDVIREKLRSLRQ